MNLSSIRIILVRPRNPGNIGACARAMSNFGFNDLVVVDPYHPLLEEAKAAPDAEDLLKKARVTKTYEEALEGCRTVWGTSSFAHRTQEQAIVSLPDLHTMLTQKKKRIAIVFGSERSGLSNGELARCDAILQIPMTRPKVSMNLAQAVAVTLYEIMRTDQGAGGSATRRRNMGSFADPPTRRHTDPNLIEEWIRLAQKVGYPPGYTDAARAGRIRKAMQQASLGPEASRFLLSFTRWIGKKTQGA